jgi:hypothetical protein
VLEGKCHGKQGTREKKKSFSRSPGRLKLIPSPLTTGQLDAKKASVPNTHGSSAKVLCMGLKSLMATLILNKGGVTKGHTHFKRKK